MNPAMMAGVMGATPASGAGAGTFDTDQRQQQMMALAKALRGGMGQQQQQPGAAPATAGQVIPVNQSAGLSGISSGLDMGSKMMGMFK